jgi:O-antigen/teichoic acid export membrane protein
MLRSLAFNIVLTGATYFIVSLIGLLLAPILIASFGLGGYGQIILARIFLPSAAFGFLDLGVGETATRVTATARANDDWHSASQSLTLLAVLSFFVSVSVAIPVAVLCWHVATWFSINPDQAAEFVGVLQLTAILLPLLFLSLIAEGIIKGFEKFAQLRACELASASVYGGLALMLVWGDGSANDIAYSFLTGLVVRALIAMILAFRLCWLHAIRPARWDVHIRSQILAWSRAMLTNKILGTLQTQAASPLLGLFSGPAAVGLFDAIVRLPRFAKSIYGLTASTVLPQAARLQVDNATSEASKLGYVGTLGSFVLFTPITILAMGFAQPILFHWLGFEVSSHWPWFSLMMIIPLLNASISFGGAMLMADYSATKKLNRLALIQVFFQIILSLILLTHITPWSFVIGQVFSTLLVFPAQLELIRRHLSLDRSLTKWLTIILFTSIILTVGLRVMFPMPDAFQLVVLLTVAGVIGTVILTVAIIPGHVRRVFTDLIWYVRLRS